MTEVHVPNRRIPMSVHSFKIHGSVFELYRSKGQDKTVKYKRYFVSPEFVELFYRIHDGGFDNSLYERLSDNEKKLMSYVLSYLNIDSKEFNIVIAKFVRGFHDRLKVIEGAIKAGNLSTELHDEYVRLMTELAELGLMQKNIVSQHINAIGRTLKAQTLKS